MKGYLFPVEIKESDRKVIKGERKRFYTNSNMQKTCLVKAEFQTAVLLKNSSIQKNRVFGNTEISLQSPLENIFYAPNKGSSRQHRKPIH